MAQISGSMSPEERQAEEETFRQPDVHLMLATDAAGEGLNLQFCHLMINDELPWNPNRMEQRIGRLHRYGQEREVCVYNMQVINTRKGIILMRLLEKLKTIERQLGGYAPNILGLTTRDVGINLNRLSDQISKTPVRRVRSNFLPMPALTPDLSSTSYPLSPTPRFGCCRSRKGMWRSHRKTFRRFRRR
jgi:superfamily II DNA/RNA helicase